MSKSSPSKILKFRNLLWKLHYKLEKNGQHTSFEKLTDDPRYRAIILGSALENTNDTSLIELAEKIVDQEKVLDIHYVLTEDDYQYDITDSTINAIQKKDDTWLKATLLTLLFVIISISVYSCKPPEKAVITHSIPDKYQTSINLKVVEPELVAENSNAAPTVLNQPELPQLVEQTATHTQELIASVDAEINHIADTQQTVLPVIPPTHTIMRLHGSNTVGEKLAPTLIKAYLTSIGANNIKSVVTAKLEKSISAHLPEQGWVNIELHAHGSTTAFKDLAQGLTDMGMASRKIKDKEVLELKDRYGDLTRPISEHVLGLDGLAIIVNKANPIEQLNSKQLAQLFSGEINNWSAFGGDNIPVTIYAREANSGTWDTFKNLVLKKHHKKLSPAAIRYESSSKLSDEVSEDSGAIGFIGLPYVRHSKLLAVADDANAQSIIPTLFTVGTEDYPLSRRLYFYTPEKQSIFMRDFIEFTQSSLGQNIVKKIGFISQNIYSVKPAIPSNAPTHYQTLVKNLERLSLNFRFHSGSDLLDNKALQDIERLTHYLSANPGKRLSLLGFSDSIGEDDYNITLSENRARAVDAILQRRGIYANTIKGFGEAMPIASNMTKAGRNKNRRVEIWVEK